MALCACGKCDPNDPPWCEGAEAVEEWIQEAEQAEEEDGRDPSEVRAIWG